VQGVGRDPGITTMGLMLPTAAEEDDPSDVVQVVEDNQDQRADTDIETGEQEKGYVSRGKKLNKQLQLCHGLTFECLGWKHDLLFI